MRTYQTRVHVADDAPLRAYAAVFGRALRSLHASRHSGNVLEAELHATFGLTSRQYNAVKFSLDAMESSIVELRPGRIADLQQRIKAADKKLVKLPDKQPRPKWARPKNGKRTSKSPERAPRTFEQIRAQAARFWASRAFRIHNVERRRADGAPTTALNLGAVFDREAAHGRS